MKNLISLLFLLAATIASGQADLFVGDWHGIGEVMGQELRLSFHFEQSGDSLIGTMDSPDQQVFGYKITSCAVEGQKIELLVNRIELRYSGEYKEGKVDGAIAQGPMVIPVILGREELAAKYNRKPQEPRDFPYHVEKVSFVNPYGGHSLSGTFTRPEKEGEYPCVVLITGSGPQNRNSEILGHKPFLVLSDHLTKNGWAVLRYDDRGIAESQGTFLGTTYQGLASDALAAARYAISRKDVLDDKLGLMGHSEGGLLAPYLAARNPEIAYIVVLAGPGTPGYQIILDQTELIMRANGLPPSDVAEICENQAKLLEVVRAHEDSEELRRHLEPVLDSMLQDVPQEELDVYGGYEALKRSRIKELSDPWYGSFVRSDVREEYMKVTCPVLALNGELDLQVPWEANLNGIRRACAKGSNSDLVVRSFPGLNHLFQNSETGAPSEYGSLEETFSTDVLEVIVEWLHNLP